MPIEVKIGQWTFSSKVAFVEHCSAILHRDKIGTEITGNDADFVDTILRVRSDKIAELAGRKVVRYLRKMHRHNTPCFFAELDDGKMLDVSFMKFIKAYPFNT